VEDKDFFHARHYTSAPAACPQMPISPQIAPQSAEFAESPQFRPQQFLQLAGRVGAAFAVADAPGAVD